MQISFTLPWARIGKGLDIDSSRGICDYTSATCAKEAERLGHTVQIVDINAMSPTLKGEISHRVVVITESYLVTVEKDPTKSSAAVRNDFILDHPQTELLKHAEGKNWTHVCSIMSNDIAPEFSGFKIPIQGECMAIEWLFKPADTVIPDRYDSFDRMLINSILGVIDNVQSTKGKYPVYTGTYCGLPVRYDTNSDCWEYIPKQQLQWVVDTFAPRLIPVTAKDITKAYSVNGDKVCKSIYKQLKGVIA